MNQTQRDNIIESAAQALSREIDNALDGARSDALDALLVDKTIDSYEEALDKMRLAAAAALEDVAKTLRERANG
jgi:hypothetical protein